MVIDWYSVITVIAFVAICLYLVKLGYTSKVKTMMFYLVCKAEIVYGSGTGNLKYSQVTCWIYERLPKIIQIIFTQKEIDKLLESAVQDMKTWLSKNDKAREYIENAVTKEEGI